MQSKWMVGLLLGGLVLFAGSAHAHVPYLEFGDFTEERPFDVGKSVEKSIAVYAWLQVRNERSDDVDAYALEVKQSGRVFIEVLVPVCEGYAEFNPTFSLVGPGLPPAASAMPFRIPAGHGMIMAETVQPALMRETFYEPFGGKSYYRGPTLDIQVTTPGSYRAYVWDPGGRGGDYVAVVGWKEQWGLRDILRALLVTPLIRWDLELHARRAERRPRRKLF